MLTRIWNTLPKLGRSRNRPECADRLSALVEEEGCIHLGRELPTSLGMNRRQAVRAAYDLALEERAQLRADGAGRLQLMSNRLFNRMVMEALFGKEACIVDELPDALREVETMTGAPQAADAIVVDEMETVVLKIHAGADGDTEELPWYTVDLPLPEAESADNHEKTNAGRQSLPDRKREPWVSLGRAVEKESENQD